MKQLPSLSTPASGTGNAEDTGRVFAEPAPLGSLFSGSGALDMAVAAALARFGVCTRLAWVCENDEAACAVLDHHFPSVPNLGDITAVDWSRVDPVTVVAGSSPCQSFSTAGRREGMVEGAHSSLWMSMADAIRTLRPELVFWENVRGALSATAATDFPGPVPCPWCAQKAGTRPLRAMGRVVADLDHAGYDCVWREIKASDVGACHQRSRIWLVAWRRGTGTLSVLASQGRTPADAPCEALEGPRSDVGLLDGFPAAWADDLAHSPVRAAWDENRDIWVSPERLCRDGHQLPFSTVWPTAGACLAGEVRSVATPPLPPAPGPLLHTPRATRGGSSTENLGMILTERLLPTPVASPSHNSPQAHLRKKPGRTVATDLEIIVDNGLLATGGKIPSAAGVDLEPDAEGKLLPTPVAHDAASNGLWASRQGPQPLSVVAAGLTESPLLPTPRASDSDKGGYKQVGAVKGDLTLSTAISRIDPGMLADCRCHSWGAYMGVVHRQAAIFGIPAPVPSAPTGRDGRWRLTAEATEWMMGHVSGWLTDDAIWDERVRADGKPWSASARRVAGIRISGNGVVPQQGEVAYVWLLTAALALSARPSNPVSL